MNTILFLCTGNYYRSRFAEEIFNHRSKGVGLEWRAISRALSIERGSRNVGPVSAHTYEALVARGIRIPTRYPQQCSLADLKMADVIVALDDTEHRPLLLDRFAKWHGLANFWNIEDVHVCLPVEALASIELEVESLVNALRGPKGALIVLRNEEGKFLLQHRTEDAPTYPDYWSFFGGQIEQGETPEQAVKREAIEELRYELKLPFLVGTQYQNEPDRGCINYVFVEAYNGAELVLGEGQAFGWFLPAATKHLLMNEHDRSILKQLVDIAGRP